MGPLLAHRDDVANFLMRASSVRSILSGEKRVTRRPFSTTNTMAFAVEALKHWPLLQLADLVGRRPRDMFSLGHRVRHLDRTATARLLRQIGREQFRLKSNVWGVWVFKKRCKGPSYLLAPRLNRGDVIGVREPWRHRWKHDPVGFLKRPGFAYEADYAEDPGGPPRRFRNALYMPAKAVRLYLELTACRADLDIRKIGVDEARREGFGSPKDFVAAYRAMHDGLPPSWAFSFRALRSAKGPWLFAEKVA